MRRTPPPAGWEAKWPPAEPRIFLGVVRLISTAEIPDDLFFSHEIQRWLESYPPGSGRPIRLNQDALASVVNRLANPGWRCWLEQHPDAARHVGLILQRLHHRISILDKRSNGKVHASLVARRLVLVAAWGGVPYPQEDLLSFLNNRLPPPWDPTLPGDRGCPPDQWASKQSAVTRFIGEVWNFWSDVPARHHKPRSDLTIREDMEGRLERGIDYAIASTKAFISRRKASCRRWAIRAVTVRFPFCCRGRRLGQWPASRRMHRSSRRATAKFCPQAGRCLQSITALSPFSNLPTWNTSGIRPFAVSISLQALRRRI